MKLQKIYESLIDARAKLEQNRMQHLEMSLDNRATDWLCRLHEIKGGLYQVQQMIDEFWDIVN
jgi:hypothetical protein